ncbi:MAG: glycosyltransferase family 2 protein [Candidatus Omnitrophica bacterium]|nr:glycosyltransferase family 2 protein [Candidatus Omnitrophota bacterium]MDD5430367.1 glycosyltransferase family 2 protein [Candidatus Omnitrophota bacterium]
MELVSIVIPVWNAAKTIGNLVEELIKTLGEKNTHIVLVNDGSHDDSHKICSDLFKKYPSLLTYINLSRNFGEHNAVMAGLNYAKGDHVVIMDDDFQNPPAEALKLIEEAKGNNYEVVYSYYKERQHGWFRKAGSNFNNWVANFMLDKPKDLYLSSFKCLSKFVVGEVIKYKGPFPYIDGLALRCTRSVGKVQVNHDKRKAGGSGYTLKKLIRLWLNMFVNFSAVPLRVSALLGLFFSCLGVLFSIYIIIEKTFHPEIPLGWPSLIIAVMTFSGVQLLILGVLGEYLGSLFLSNNGTPQFIIREIHKSDR